MNLKEMKAYCNKHYLKFEKATDFGFIASTETKARGERNVHSQRIISADMNGGGRTFHDMHVDKDGGILLYKSHRGQHPMLSNDKEKEKEA